MNHICQQCKQRFTTSRKAPKFCSKHCKDKSQLTEMDMDKAIALYQSGMTQKEVAIQMKRSQKAIFNLLKRQGVKSRKAIKRNQAGKSNANWKGGVIVHNGYIVVNCHSHPRARKDGGYVPEHILVIEKNLGRHLVYLAQGHPDNEVVHHINHNKQDNRIENLQLMSASEHTNLHNEVRKVKSCKPVKRIDTGKIYSSTVEAAKAVKLHPSSIQSAARKGHKSSGTYWQYVTT